jgi:hypothetical protein
VLDGGLVDDLVKLALVLVDRQKEVALLFAAA